MRWSKVTLVAIVWFFSAVHFKMASQAAFHWGCILTLVALVWFFSSIICVSQRNIYIGPTFTEVIICKILIHHHQVENGVPCVLSVSNWENGKWEWEKRTNESESHRQYEILQDHQPQTRPEHNEDNERRKRQFVNDNWNDLEMFPKYLRIFIRMIQKYSRNTL